ncbi:uncharacterized protein METZ01_LOCUS407437, partial [marine metagenome]
VRFFCLYISARHFLLKNGLRENQAGHDQQQWSLPQDNYTATKGDFVILLLHL